MAIKQTTSKTVKVRAAVAIDLNTGHYHIVGKFGATDKYLNDLVIEGLGPNTVVQWITARVPLSADVKAQIEK